MSRIRIRAEGAPWRTAVEFQLVYEIPGFKRLTGILKDAHMTGIVEDKEELVRITFVEVETHVAAASTFSISNEDAQVLLDDLWQYGLRPSDGVGSVGQLRATEKHLEDMRNYFEKLFSETLLSLQEKKK